MLGNSWYQPYQQNSVPLTFSQKQKFISVSSLWNLGAVFGRENTILAELSVAS